MADLPPSSRCTRLTVWAATSLTRRAGPGGTGERHHVDAGVGGDGLPDHRAGARHEVEHTGRQPDLVDDLGEDEGVERRDLAGLEHHRAARGQRRCDLGHDLVQRVVPGGDAADDADGLAHHQGVAQPLLEGERVEQAGVVAGVHGGQPGLDELGHLDGHPHLTGDDLGQLAAAGRQGFGQGLEVTAAFGHRGGRPGIERGPGGRHGPVYVVGRPLGDGAHHLLGGGVDDLDCALTGAVDPGTVDEEPVVGADGCAHWFPQGCRTRRAHATGVTATHRSPRVAIPAVSRATSR